MKTFLTSIVTILFATNVALADFQYNGIRYVPLESDPTLVLVSSAASTGLVYEGDIVIPETVYDLEKDKSYTVVAIGSSAFKDCKELTSLTMPSTVETIGYQAFRATTKLTSITLPSNVSSIAEFAFYGSGITSIEIPEGVERIETQTFTNCLALKEVILPSTINYIGTKAFNKCSGIEKFTCKAVEAPVLEVTEGQPFGQSSYTTADLYVPADAIDSYTKATHWGAFKAIEAMVSTSIEAIEGKDIFSQYGNVISFVEPTSITVYNLAGGVIYQGRTEEYIIPSTGLYIIHTEKGSFKVMGK